MSTKYIASNWRLPNKAGVDSYLNDNYGLTFDGNELIECENISSLNNVSKFSISFWFKISDFSSVARFLGTYSGNTNNWLMCLFVPSTGLRFLVRNNDTSKADLEVVSSGKITLNNWQHVSMVYDGNESGNANRLKVYLNGVQESLTFTGTIPATTASNLTGVFNIGSDGYSSQGAKDISEVAVFDYALSSTQVSTLYGSSSLGAGNPMALKPSPVAFYPLGDNSSGNPLTQPNEAVEDASVFDFDGISQFINAGNTTYLNNLTEMTLSIWFNLDVAVQNKGLISDRQSTGGNGHFSIATKGISGNGYSFRLYLSRSDGVEASIQISNQPFTAGQWHNLIMTFNAGTVIFYADGSLAPSAIYRANNGIPTTLGSTAESLDIGKYLTLEWDGQISNVAIWNSDQSSEISNIYNSGVPATTYTNTPTAWYKLDQSANWEADSSGAWQIPDAVSAYPQSFDFDGAIGGALINLGNDSGLNITGSLSVSAWFKTLNNTDAIVIATKDDGGANRAWQLYMISSGALRFAVNGVAAFATSSGVYDDGKWHHVLAVYEPSNYLKLYIDGSEDGADTTSVPASLNSLPSQDVVIGGYSVFDAAGGRRWDGQLSNIAIFNSNQTSEKDNIYNLGLPALSYTNTPSAWYKLDNTATFSTNWSIPDASGNGNTGTSSGMTEQNLVNNNVSALNGESSGMTSANLVLTDLTRNLPYDSYSFDFDGTGNYIDCGNDSSLSPSSFTFSVWTKSSQLNLGTWIGKYASENYGFGLYSGDIYLHIKTSAGWGGLSVTASSYLTVNNWHHIVGTYDETNLKIYVDGNLAGTLAKAGPITYTTRNTRLGNLEGTSALDYDGFISNVSIFDEALTSTEVMKLYSNGMPQDLSTFTPAPVAWWTLGSNSFFNGSNFICKDLSGNGNDGTSVNAGVDALQGNTPRSDANGTGTNMDIPTNLEGTTKYSSNNSWSINMSESARVADTP